MVRQARTLVGLAGLLLAPLVGSSRQWVPDTPAMNASTHPSCTQGLKDGQHDFDFFLGKWKVHNRKLVHPLSGSTQWIEFDGMTMAKKLWDGQANMEEYQADTPSGRIEGMTVRIYNASSHQWSEYWANSKNGAFSLPATVGHFANGRGEFFDQEEFNGRPIQVRFVWENLSPKVCRWEQAFSADGGKTWETNWTMDYTRVTPAVI